MSRPLKVLLIEDSEDDAELLRIELKRGPYNPLSLTRVDTMNDMKRLLTEESWDIIVSDYNIPAFSVPRALDFIHEIGMDIPFIVISGAVGEEMAVQVMKAGAQDFIRKDNLSRLIPAIERELHELEERKKRIAAEEALVRSEAKFEELFQSATDVIVMVDRHGSIININRRGEEVTGYSIHQLLSMNVAEDLATEPEKEYMRQIIQKTVQGEYQAFELTWQASNGTPRHFSGNATPRFNDDGSYLFSLCILRDVTNRRLAEEALRKEKEFVSTVIRNLSDGIAVVGSNRQFKLISPAMERVFGYSVQDTPVFDVWVERVFPENENRQFMLSVFESEIPNEPPVEKVFPFTHHNGSNRWCRLKIASMGDHDIIINSEDITDRKQIEDELAAERELLSVTLQSVGEAVITCDITGKVVLMNPVAEEVTGWSSGEGLGVPLSEVFKIYSEKSGEQWKDTVSAIMDAQTLVDFTAYPHLIDRSGEERFISGRGSRLRNRNGDIIGVVIVFRDITKQQNLEKELQRRQRLESIAVLAGGISHDFNNILTAILGNLNLARNYLDTESKATERLSRAERAALQAKSLTDKLLTFSKGGSPVKQTSSIEEILRESTSFILTGANVRAEFRIPTDIWPVEVDVGQINQVINNLVINAAQAMPNGGTITISCDNVSIAEEAGVPLDPGRYVKVSVSDEGYGIPEKDLPRIFDPYFTTKQQGSGLGLSIAYSVIRKHGGYIGVDSRENAGTTFFFYLPATDREKKTTPGTEQPKETLNCKVLVMDDESIVREVVGEMLNSSGCDVGYAKDGREAIDEYRDAEEQGKPFDVVIMDLTIPGGMGGKEAIREIKEINPDVKAIVSSGYSNEPVMSEYKKYGFQGVLTKPFKLQELTSLLYTVLHT